ncbi:DUF6624 domain-containing protein [Streptomyces jumonjinensis]|uniref:DUF6624 domain-containing protein n=1 Tax=Streptomyces jumonjinensis TaxID=1945 RepID=UPI00379C8739
MSGCGCGYPESAWTWWDQPYRAEDPVPCGDGALVVPVPARPDLAADLIGRAQAARERRRADFLSRYGQSAHVLVNEANALALRRIVSVHGWPGSRLVGVRGAEAALSVALGVDRSFFLRTLLRMLDTAVASGDAPRVHQALVYDRMCVLEGRPQRYGTQFRSGRGGVREVWPVAEPELLDIRRADVGLPPAARARGAVGPECGERALA